MENVKILFFTDPHIFEGKGSDRGFESAVRKMNDVHADIWICGGDISKSPEGFDFYNRAIKTCECPILFCMGNHEIDNKHYEPQKSASYSSVHDVSGVCIIILDVLQVDKNLDWFGGVRKEQIDWLKKELKKISLTHPILLVTHIPLITSYPARRGHSTDVESQHHIINAEEIMELLLPFNSVVNLSGHEHQNARIFKEHLEILNSTSIGGHRWSGWPQPRGMDSSPAGYRLIEVGTDGALLNRYITIFEEGPESEVDLYIDEDMGYSYVNVFDGSARTHVIANAQKLTMLNPFSQESFGLRSAHLWRLPYHFKGHPVKIIVRFESSRTVERCVREWPEPTRRHPL